MAYLIQNTRTDDFIDDDGNWTVVRSFAHRFRSKSDAERYIDKHTLRGDDPYMKVVTESTHRSFKKFMEAKKLTEDKRYDDEIVRKAFMTALGGKNWDKFIQAGYDGKLHTWNEINNFLVKAGASFNDCAKVSNKLEDLEDDHHYADCVYGGCKKIKEDVLPDGWLKNLMNDVKNGEGWCTDEYIALAAQEELGKNVWGKEKEIMKQVQRLGYGKYVKAEESVKHLKEDVDQKIVIHTKNGKVDSIEQGTYMPNGVFIRNGGHHFDKGFIGMDPQEAKAALVKYSRIPEKMIIVESKKIVEEYTHEDGDWWTSKSKEFQDQYIKEHPNSKYAKNAKSQKSLNKQPLKTEKTDEKTDDGTYFLKGFNGDKEVLEIELDSKTYQAAKKEAMQEMDNYIVDDEDDEDDYVNDDDVELWELHYIKTDKDGHVNDKILGKY